MTNLPDWSALLPVLPGEGKRTRALYAALRRLIEAGDLPAGTKLPTTRDLARRFSLSRAAAVAAFEMLVADGFACARVGAGTFVAEEVPTLPAITTPQPARQKLNAEALPCALGVAMQDSKTMTIFRKLLTRHLSRPGPEHFAYGDPRGQPVLRKAIAAYLRTARGVRCDEEQIVVTAGTQQGLDLLVRAAIRPGDAVWIEDPCFPMARAAFADSGARLVGIPVDGEGLDPVAGERLCRQAAAVYVTPSHQYPLGVTMTMRRRLALIDWAKRHGAWIFEDDYDSEFRYAGPPLAAMQGMDASGRVAYFGTFSKVLFPGLRMGYVVVPEPLLDRVLTLRDRTDRYPATLGQGAVADLLDEGHFAAHLRRTRRRAEASRDALVAALRTHCGDRFSFESPEQGLHLVMTWRSEMDDIELASALQARGVGAKPLSRMYVDALPRQGLVLGFSGFPHEQLAGAAATIGAVFVAARSLQKACPDNTKGRSPLKGSGPVMSACR